MQDLLIQGQLLQAYLLIPHIRLLDELHTVDGHLEHGPWFVFPTSAKKVYAMYSGDTQAGPDFMKNKNQPSRF
jgi:hypothetical protein